MPPSKAEAHAALKLLIATLKADDPRRNELSQIYLLLWLIDDSDGRTNSLAGVLGGAYGQGGAQSLLEEVITIMRWVANGGDIWIFFLKFKRCDSMLINSLKRQTIKRATA
jgi:hypothetical protein